MDGMFGINGTEMIILIVLALIVVGPSRMPEYAKKLGEFVKTFRRKALDARRAVREDFGDEFDLDWQKLDPRQYDPRRIVREALAEEDGQQIQQGQQSQTATQTAVTVGPIERYMEQAKKRDRSKPAPFDSEAT
ncbi:putative twin arginine-targeting protein translocase TatB [Brevibacterium mcbrellneri ATCC 49030]|uniref:Putative twin arginine-targeting protein translocase TatB n=2 Tax=Brevibacterium TaxID=1696 RepID=D4YK47_9MICO|nr:putative twin arginine-targeting protein translocase TatB [Brevibacterium mcbrellneri ATCC 49030]